MMGGLNIELLRFLLVGICANVINYAIFLFVYWLEGTLFTASITGYVAGLLCSYHFGRIWVFGNKFDISKENVFRFLAVYVVGGLGMCSLIEVLVRSSLMNHQVSWFFGASFAMVNNFFGVKKLVFNKGTNK
jgi:putative flippase GtrA